MRCPSERFGFIRQAFRPQRCHGPTAERVALDYATELTRDKYVSPETFARLRTLYSEREICDIVWLVASEYLWNMSNIGLGIGSDGMCELDPKLRAAG